MQCEFEKCLNIQRDQTKDANTACNFKERKFVGGSFYFSFPD